MNMYIHIYERLYTYTYIFIYERLWTYILYTAPRQLWLKCFREEVACSIRLLSLFRLHARSFALSQWTKLLLPIVRWSFWSWQWPSSRSWRVRFWDLREQPQKCFQIERFKNMCFVPLINDIYINMSASCSFCYKWFYTCFWFSMNDFTESVFRCL